MEYQNDKLRIIQQIEYEILKKLDKICSVNNIEYFLIGGTALGAKRHGGFIPWDDDIDVGMTRDNYNKFINLEEKEFGDDILLQTPYNDGPSPFPYAKLRRKNTKFVEYCNRNIKMKQGIYIDIFPYDNIPDNEFLRKRQFHRVKKWTELYVNRQKPDYPKQNKKLLDYIKQIVIRMRFIVFHNTKNVNTR